MEMRPTDFLPAECPRCGRELDKSGVNPEIDFSVSCPRCGTAARVLQEVRIIEFIEIDGDGGE